MEEDRLKVIWDAILDNLYSEKEWRQHPDKLSVEELWGKSRSSGEWIKTAYVRMKNG